MSEHHPATIGDGFRIGIGFFFAQVFLVIALALGLYLIGYLPFAVEQWSQPEAPLPPAFQGLDK